MNRKLLFAIPFFFESITSFFLAAIPYLAMDLGGRQSQVGLVSTILLAAQIPFFYIIGSLVNRFGKYPVLYAGSVLITVFVFITSKSPNLRFLTVLATIGFLGHAIFYPALQALMGDMSTGERLTKDVGVYNMGWCFGAAFVAVSSPYIYEIANGVRGLLYAGCFCGIVSAVLVTYNYIISKNKSKVQKTDVTAEESVPENNNVYLLMGRLGMFLGFFSYGAYRYILPIIFREFGWQDSLILLVTGMFMVGEAIGVIGCAFITFWKMKTAPQIIANIVFFACALSVLFLKIPWILGAFFLVCGIAMAVCYTSALFHAVSSHSSVRAKNTGYHELIVASGMVAACLVGSLGGKLMDMFVMSSMKFLPIYVIMAFVVFNLFIYKYLGRNLKEK
ncbi:MAG: MFS transporter [Armatimonadetes bacterium]|nr:MFS transporter [Candidatus Hippobium faecium]